MLNIFFWKILLLYLSCWHASCWWNVFSKQLSYKSICLVKANSWIWQCLHEIMNCTSSLFLLLSLTDFCLIECQLFTTFYTLFVVFLQLFMSPDAKCSWTLSQSFFFGSISNSIEQYWQTRPTWDIPPSVVFLALFSLASRSRNTAA